MSTTTTSPSPRYGTEHYPKVDIYLHRDSEGLWALTLPNGTPQKVTDAKAVIAAVPNAGERTVRVIDTDSRSNVLILDLVGHKAAGLIDRIQVCSPMCVPPALKSGLSEDLLWQLSQWNPLKPSLGGWHDVVDNDILVRQMAQLPDDKATEAFDRHPISQPLKFLSTLDHLACARVMGMIRDPRWFVDENNPHSVSKITKFLGLMPRTQRGVSGNNKPIYHHERCASVLEAWQGNGQPANWDTDAGSYFWRIWEEHGRDWRADMKTSRAFIRFLRDLWVYTLYQDNHDIRQPSQFFTDPLVASAFRDHCAVLEKPLLTI